MPAIYHGLYLGFLPQPDEATGGPNVEEEDGEFNIDVMVMSSETSQVELSIMRIIIYIPVLAFNRKIKENMIVDVSNKLVRALPCVMCRLNYIQY